jgi:hypothetical protein
MPHYSYNGLEQPDDIDMEYHESFDWKKTHCAHQSYVLP